MMGISLSGENLQQENSRVRKKQRYRLREEEFINIWEDEEGWEKKKKKKRRLSGPGRENNQLIKASQTAQTYLFSP